MQYKIVTMKDRPNLMQAQKELEINAWPEFMLYDEISNKYWTRLFEVFPEYQFLMINENDEIMAIGNSIPLYWDKAYENLPESGWDWALEQGFLYDKEGIIPDILSALAIVVNKKYLGKRISPKMVHEMKNIAIKKNLKQ